MPLPLPLADAITTIITIVLMSLGALSAIANKLAEKQQANAAKARPRPQGGVQDEIEQFLREVTGDKNAQRNRGNQQNRPQQNRAQESRPQQGGGSAQPPARRRQSGQGAGNRQQREQRREQQREQQRPQERSQEQPVQQEHVSLRERSERREARRRRAEATKQQNKPASQSSGSPSNKKPVVKVVREGQAPLRPVEQVGADQAFDKLVADVTTTSSAARLTTSVPTTTARRGEPNLAMLAELRTPEAMRKAIIVSEMLQKPVAMRKSR